MIPGPVLINNFLLVLWEFIIFQAFSSLNLYLVDLLCKLCSSPERIVSDYCIMFFKCLLHCVSFFLFSNHC